MKNQNIKFKRIILITIIAMSNSFVTVCGLEAKTWAEVNEAKKQEAINALNDPDFSPGEKEYLNVLDPTLYKKLNGRLSDFLTSLKRLAMAKPQEPEYIKKSKRNSFNTDKEALLKEASSLPQFSKYIQDIKGEGPDIDKFKQRIDKLYHTPHRALA